MDTLLSQLEASLAALGSTIEQVRATLLTHNVKGVRNTARFLNPVIRYIHKDLVEPKTGMELLETGHLRLTSADGHRHETALPLAVEEFLKGFNAGDYPELELSSEEVDRVKNHP